LPFRLVLSISLLGILLAFPVAAQPAQPSVSAAQRLVDREALKSAFAKVLERAPINEARVGIEVVSLDSGEIAFSHHADDLLNPASNVKLFTAAAALARLGPSFRFETEFYTEGRADSAKGRTLFVRGKGDPSITTERLYGIVIELVHAGLRDVGDIVIDESWFDLDRAPPGWDQSSGDNDRSYVAPPGAVSLNWNAIGIYVRGADRPGEKSMVAVEPASEYVSLETRLTPGRRRRLSVESMPAGDRQRILVRGSIGVGADVWSVMKKIDNPPMYFGQTLKALLAQRGVKARGKVKLGPVPPEANLLHVAQSETLDLVLKRLNKVSSNFVAEQLIKTLAAEVRGPPGTTGRGIEVVEEFLAREVGIPRGSYVMKNGSGLNDTNRFSAAQISRLLTFMQRQFPTAPEYLSSLGIAGMDGTLRYRFEGSDAVGRLRAKTGTLENVSALSGYVMAIGGERFAFSMMVNDYAGRAGLVIQGIDAMGAALAASGSRDGPSRAVAVMFADDTRPGSLDEVRRRVRTYLALGRQADRRNVSFLRTAWRSEKDPAVRAVVAESLYRSDPQDYLAARTLLDSFSARPEVYGRLRQVAKDLNVELPGFSSVVDLGAEGNLDALSRVVELCRAAQGDAAAQRDLSEALGEVSRTAAAELLMALRSAPTEDRDAATGLLARGLIDAADPEHAFWSELKRSMGAVDVDYATFARQMEVTLSKRIAEEKAPRSVSTPGVTPPAGAARKELPVAETRPGG
jgi:D-alanyl-D-alanine carboxypeptidase/D-alanyl-D-alanine-endopeptidase (penicillin-binding protein 4)